MKATLHALLAALVSVPVTSTALDLVPFGSTWDYMHPADGVDPALADADFDTTWMDAAVDFDTDYDGPTFGSVPALAGPPFDSGSGPAPLGYGAIEAIDVELGGFGTTLTTPPSGQRGTAYFRHKFDVTEAVDSLALEIVADDAAVVYIDGVELTRLNMPFADTYGSNSVANGDETGTSRFEGGLGGLAPGSYVIAVSIHQTAGTSSDLGFDLRLSDEGLANPPIGNILFGAAPAVPLLTDGNEPPWVASDTDFVSVTGAGTTVLRSESVDLSTVGDTLFSVVLAAGEVSGGSNFEDDDTLNAYLEITDGGIASTISLLPFGLDADGDGTINGDEFAPGAAANFATQFAERVTARIPASATGATLVVEATNNSATETFQVGAAFVEEAAGPAPVIGTLEFGAPVELFADFGPQPWVETGAGEFTLNGTGFVGILTSEDIDLTGLPPATASLTLNARDTSTGTNFETGDSFQAFVEVADADGLGSVIELVDGGADANGDNILDGEEFAPGVDPAVLVDEAFVLAATLPPGTVRARFVILGINNSASEFFTISGVSIAPTPPGFEILSIVASEGEADITWESEAGATYELEISPDLSEGSWSVVSTVTATGPTTEVNHGANAPRAYYRVRRLP